MRNLIQLHEQMQTRLGIEADKACNNIEKWIIDALYNNEPKAYVRPFTERTPMLLDEVIKRLATAGIVAVWDATAQRFEIDITASLANAPKVAESVSASAPTVEQLPTVDPVRVQGQIKARPNATTGCFTLDIMFFKTAEKLPKANTYILGGSDYEIRLMLENAYGWHVFMDNKWYCNAGTPKYWAYLPVLPKLPESIK